jgi:WD40 repeat protein
MDVRRAQFLLSASCMLFADPSFLHPDCSCSQQLTGGHTGSVTMLALLFLPALPPAVQQTTPGLCCLCASAASDASVVIWGGDSLCIDADCGGSSSGAEQRRGWRQLQMIPGGENVTLALSLGCVVREGGELHVFLAVGGTGGGVRLFSFNASTCTFDLAANLTGTRILRCCSLRHALPLFTFLSFFPFFTAGHSDWVKSISFSPPQPDASLILASGSQDCTIRLTRIFPMSSSLASTSSVGTFGQKLHAFPSFSLSSSPSSTPSSFVCELYSVLRSHTDWVHSVRWVTSSPQLCLFSASADKSIALWREGTDGVWCETRAGRIGGGVMSFCGGACSNRGDRLMAHSHTGGGGV